MEIGNAIRSIALGGRYISQAVAELVAHQLNQGDQLRGRRSSRRATLKQLTHCLADHLQNETTLFASHADINCWHQRARETPFAAINYATYVLILKATGASAHRH